MFFIKNIQNWHANLKDRICYICICWKTNVIYVILVFIFNIKCDNSTFFTPIICF